jgi:phytoene/squalene synthetase
MSPAAVTRPTAPAGPSPELRSAYDTCRRLHAEHGRTYYLATRLLPAWKRPYVHALYGFARYADELVDGPFGGTPAGQAEADAALAGLERGLLAAFASDSPPGRGTQADVLRALKDTAQRWDLPPAYFTTFLTAMRMDLTVREYETWEDLLGYVEGSAAVIGLQMLPILEPTSRAASAYARDLGIAFQLANFLRDVGEDLRRGRIYLPLESLRLFGVTREHLLTGGGYAGCWPTRLRAAAKSSARPSLVSDCCTRRPGTASALPTRSTAGSSTPSKTRTTRSSTAAWRSRCRGGSPSRAPRSGVLRGPANPG